MTQRPHSFGIDPSLAVILGGVSAAIHIGKLPPALPALQHGLGLSLMQSGFLLSIVQLAGMLLGLAVGLAAERIGLRRTMLAGVMVGGIASAVGAQASGAGLLLATRAFEGLGFLLVSMPGPGLLRRLVPPQRLAGRLGLWGAYMPIGTGAALLLGPSWISRWGWPSWWWAAAWCSLAAAVLVQACVPPDPRGTQRPASGSVSRWPGALRVVLGARGPWLVALAFAAYSAQWMSVIGFLPTIYANAGIAPGVAGLATAVVAASNMIGNIASGRLLQRGWPAHRLLQAGYATMASMALLAFAPWTADAWFAFTCLLLFSAVGGLVPGTLFSLAVRFTPPRGTVSATVGLLQQLSSTGQVVGPPLVALAASVSGGWHYNGVVTASFAGLGLLLAASTRVLLRHETSMAAQPRPHP